MKIMEITMFSRAGTKYYKPLRGFTLFKHCSNGKDAVNGYEFENHVKPLLLLHGIEEVNVL